MKVLGLVINPIAGIGGMAGLKGSDGAIRQHQAMKEGFGSPSQDRTMTALRELLHLRDSISILTFPGEMGQDVAQKAGFSTIVIGSILHGATDGQDTIKAAKEMLLRGADLILFAGGDGTARDVFTAVADRIPTLGIPSGVKIHSSVYAHTPSKAGQLAAKFLLGTVSTTLGEVMDIDEEVLSKGIVTSKLFGALRIPLDSAVQYTKCGGYSPKSELEGMTLAVKEQMLVDTLCIFGPGSTIAMIQERLGLEATLLGIDAVLNSKVVGTDLNEKLLWELLQVTPQVKLFITVIGGQGYILGRGNQQLSPRIIRKIGRENILLVATKAKLADLRLRPLLSDCGDPQLDQELRGYISVIVGANETVPYRIGE